MKKSISILLLISFIIPFWGAVTILQFQKTKTRIEVKKQIKAGLFPEELTLLKFSKMEARALLHWEHNKEFEFNGQMYDIIERGQSGDSLWFLSYWDHHETKIKRKLNKLFSSNAKPIVHNRDAIAISFSQIKANFCENTSHLLYANESKCLSPLEYSTSVFHTDIGSPTTPPPQV